MADRTPMPSRLIGELELGDTAVEVREFDDGTVTIAWPDASEGLHVLNPADFQQMVGFFDRIGKEKGWL